MAGVVGALLRAGVTVKLGHLKQATSSYIDDRMDNGRATLAGYAIGAAFYAAAGIFLIAALLVGSAALFRWVEIKYGLFHAFGATGIVLVALMLLCVIIAAAALSTKKKNYQSLGSRLKTALHASPAKAEKNLRQPSSSAASLPTRIAPDTRDPIASARNTAASILRAPSRPKRGTTSETSPVAKSAGAAAAIGLLGWALSRRYRRPAPSPVVKRRR